MQLILVKPGSKPHRIDSSLSVILHQDCQLGILLEDVIFRVTTARNGIAGELVFLTDRVKFVKQLLIQVIQQSRRC